MAIIVQLTKEENFSQITFRSSSGKEYRLLLNKLTGMATVETDYIHYMNYGYEKTGFPYKVYTGTLKEVKKYSLDSFLDQFK